MSYLHLGGNPLSGNIPNSLGYLYLLKDLNIKDTQLSGTIPLSFAQLSSLTTLYADGNRFNETVASSPLPPSLVDLRLSLDRNQSVSETFFHNLTSLNSLYLSNCVLNISKSWIPSFQLETISIMSCMINDKFPPWISTQFSLVTLDLVDTGLVGKIPSWLGETNPDLQYLNLSRNHLEGALFSISSSEMSLIILDVSSNSLSGNIPSNWCSSVEQLQLNDNLFSGNIPSSLGEMFNYYLLNLANNNLTGVIPMSLFKYPSLTVLNLGNNSLEGGLPHEFNELTYLYSLVVRNDKLNGSLFPSIADCSQLQVLDAGENFFGGEISKLIENLSKLGVLVMKDNNFIGSIPLEIGKLKSLQILLLSSNHISGSIPHTIVSMEAMVNTSQDGFILSASYNVYYRDGLVMNLKGTVRSFSYILSTLTVIDLSNNELEGELVSDFGNLKGLRLLNLSMNNFNETIPNSLGEMSQLESLDLSKNYFSGRIPVELESLNFLGSLNLSNNNLSGSIPQGHHITGTFGESSYSGNPHLWGCPLPKNCSWPQFAPPPPSISVDKDKKGAKYSWYQISVGLSYGSGFGGMLSLMLIKNSWKRKCFNQIDKILKFLFPWMKNLTL
ncbi:receptor-like protein EIX1 isoform X1 [Cryptomeria japonica]|uniref:receptor-like protein EIX1 isoform X1 n=1 Tax=Cryptomeria japonica TaxID=3369 RepID=UPI0027DA1036|nr:receptor-like protein EIX1 isoform X1 [Cryptomeria japonica]